jgi:hypothetical protein
METKNPILSLSLQELNSLKIAKSKNFIITHISGNLVEDYRTRWHDIWKDLLEYIVNNYEVMAEQLRMTSDYEKKMTYGKVAEILIDKRIKHLKWLEANEVPKEEPNAENFTGASLPSNFTGASMPKEENKKEPDVDNENKWIACKKEHDVFVSKDIMFTYKELENAIDMARSLPKLDIDTIISCQIYLKTKL